MNARDEARVMVLEPGRRRVRMQPFTIDVRRARVSHTHGLSSRTTTRVHRRWLVE